MNSIVTLRRVRGLTQTELAQRIGITQQALHRYETGSQELRLSILARLAEVLDCSLEELAGGEGPLPPAQADFRQAAEFILTYCREQGLIQLRTVTEKELAVLIVEQARRTGKSRLENQRHLDAAVAGKLDKLKSS